MNPQDFIFYRQNIASADIKHPMPFKLKYIELREMLAATVRFGALEGKLKKIMKGERITTKYGIYWAEKII